MEPLLAGRAGYTANKKRESFTFPINRAKSSVVNSAGLVCKQNNKL